MIGVEAGEEGRAGARQQVPPGIAEFAGLKIAGLEFDGQSRRGGRCRSGK